MKDGEFRSTEDAVIIGIAEGIDTADALKNLKRESPYLKNYKFDRLAARSWLGSLSVNSFGCIIQS
jgi:hypothetical protein